MVTVRWSRVGGVIFVIQRAWGSSRTGVGIGMDICWVPRRERLATRAPWEGSVVIMLLMGVAGSGGCVAAIGIEVAGEAVACLKLISLKRVRVSASPTCPSVVCVPAS